ncbi:MAG TPA: DUF4294 domain-containing protein [Chitinophagaceae bacterium]|nr:DUF4294 domain-containing protein [Chitinophagaceae bacterium]
MRLFPVLLISLFLNSGISSSYAQQLFPLQGKDSVGDGIQLNEAVVVSTRLFTNDTARYHYNQMKHYVKMILPLVDTAVALFRDIDDHSQHLSHRNRKTYIRSRESEIREHFDDQIRRLNITQGRLLVKLINRQLDQNCYHIVRELKNPLSAAYYQSVARLNGINLNEDYDPEENRDLEIIMRNLGYEKEW